jgi:hypothetical protein
MTNEFEYDVALSFAREDRPIAEELTQLLRNKQLTVFQDEYTSDKNWENDLVNHLVNLYNRKAVYCVLLISRHYPLKRWGEEDRLAAQERALRDANEYIILLPLDDTKVVGVTDTPEYVNIRQQPLEHMVDLLKEKLTNRPRSSGPPAESHDLRSGNVPPTHARTKGTNAT